MGVPISVRLDDDVRDELSAGPVAGSVWRPCCATSRRKPREGRAGPASARPCRSRRPCDNVPGGTGLLRGVGDAARRCRLRLRRSSYTRDRSCSPTGAAMPRQGAQQAAPGRGGGGRRAVRPRLSERNPGAMTEDAALDPGPVGRDRASRREQPWQTLLGGVALGGHDVQGTPSCDAIPHHPGSACRHPPSDRRSPSASS